MVRHIGLVILAISFSVMTGCHIGCCSKRASEKKCPTDIRKTHCWCFGEDALFRYPCGPNRVFYGHKATCWREWPTAGSQWRDMHCGPPIAGGMMPNEADVVPEMPMTAPAPAEGQTNNPFRDEASQAAPPQAETQTQSSIESGALEPNRLPAVPENGGSDLPVVPPQDGATDQPMPQALISGDGFEPMSSAGAEPQIEYQSWSSSTERAEAPVHSQTNRIEVNTPPILVSERGRVVDNTSRGVSAAPSTPVAETGSRWRLVIHDNPHGIAADSSDSAPLFRPPSLGVNQTPAPQAQKPAPLKRSLEEQTGDALKRFMSFENRPATSR